MTIIETSRKIVKLADERKRLLEYIKETEASDCFEIRVGEHKATERIYSLEEYCMKQVVKTALLQLLGIQLTLNTESLNALGVHPDMGET